MKIYIYQFSNKFQYIYNQISQQRKNKMSRKTAANYKEIIYT